MLVRLLITYLYYVTFSIYSIQIQLQIQIHILTYTDTYSYTYDIPDIPMPRYMHSHAACAYSINKSAMTYPDERVHIQGAFGITSKLCC